MNGDIIAAVVGGLLVLALNWRAMASHGLAKGKLLQMALIWAGIILVVAAGVRLFAS